MHAGGGHGGIPFVSARTVGRALNKREVLGGVHGEVLHAWALCRSTAAEMRNSSPLGLTKARSIVGGKLRETAMRVQNAARQDVGGGSERHQNGESDEWQGMKGGQRMRARQSAHMRCMALVGDCAQH